ncbi:hypothetical protein [Sporosarcina sp. FSL W7-1283]|uniref:hypothetical protein n=1 Tax=Sporosarcina sp. FSL W7-1283 TaxID=2921560 RepID=UPI0030F68466
MKKYPVVSKKGNEYLVLIRPYKSFGYYVHLRRRWVGKIFLTVHAHYVGFPDSFIKAVNNAIYSYEESSRFEFEEWDGKIE